MNGNPTANCQGSNWIDCYQTLPISGVTWKEWPIEKAKTSAQKSDNGTNIILLAYILDTFIIKNVACTLNI